MISLSFLIMLSLLSIISVSHRTPRTVVFIILPIVAALIIASRSLLVDYSDDMFRYYSNYLSLKDGLLVNFNIDSEPLFLVINYFLHLFFGDNLSARGLLFFYSIMSTFSLSLAIYYLLKKDFEDLIGLSLICTLIGTSYLFSSGQLVRQVISICLFMAYISVENQRAKRFLLISSILTHYMILIIYFIHKILSRINISNNKLIFVFFISIPLGVILGENMVSFFKIIVSFFDVGILAKKAAYYTEGFGAENLKFGVNVTRIFYALLIVLPLMFIKTNEYRVNDFFQLILTFCIITMLFSSIDSFSRRFFVYYSIFSPLIFCLTLSRIDKRLIGVNFLVFCFFFILFMFSVTSTPNPFSLFRGDLCFTNCN